MNLEDALRKQGSGNSDHRCAIIKRLDGMPEEDRRSFDQAILMLRQQRESISMPNQTSPMSCAKLWRALMAVGYTVSKDGLEKHVYGHCRCDVDS